MDKSILELLKKAGEFSEKESILLKNELQYKKLKKDDYLLEKGNTCSSLSFIISGSFYQYSIDLELNKNIIDLNVSNDWVINHKSFTTRKPSEYSIQAFEDSSIYELSIDAIHRLIAQSQSFLQMGKVLEESTSRIDFFDNNNTPDEKYNFILKNKPNLLQKFPQKLIASYLKITPETLSRVRKRIK
ncbi:Crp/Fnr family transcriptional regulator [Polaribacter batillariae]|uniref:Crp/Fnr family transcriptional regulator n=1 Tax=Polaribacter batillariae TaxID=2808900 RepID=A0ABX7STM6_9FLAO|nr:Crp/Fnr family transcriptional regulator [Polaribacter batillariae]QTD37599.1 Crp/Fnr family transcriptional regulator [Polaribacter batillariae]